MEMGGSSHAPPHSQHGGDSACCLAVPPAIDSSPAALEAVMPLGHLPFAASLAPFHLGAGPLAEDPPPRLS
jgi:hypothetical protein